MGETREEPEMRNANTFMVHGALVTLVMVFAGCMTSESVPGSQRASLSSDETTVDFEAIPPAALSASSVVVEAPWGDSDGAYQRELEGAHTGPMAIAADPDEGFWVVDTVGARLNRYGADGSLHQVIPTGVETVDDLAAGPAGKVTLLAYRRTPTPGHSLLTIDRQGSLESERAAPQGATLPTALVADGDQIYVEHRHEWLHPESGGARLWGRPAGELMVRARLDEGDVVLWTLDRTGQAVWNLRIDMPVRVTELLALESSRPYMAVVMRHIETDTDGEPIGHRTWLVAVSHAGETLGVLQLVDRRVTDAGRPFALTPDGDVLELVTSEEGVTVLRYERVGGAS
jgi:hypothetical protein